MSTAEVIGTLGHAHTDVQADVEAEVSAQIRRLWVATLKHDWRALAIVPANVGLTAAQVARGLHRVGVCEAGLPLRFVNGAGTDLASSTRMANEVRELVEKGGRAIIVVDAPAQDEAAVPLALCADAVVLGVMLGRTTRSDIERTVSQLGDRAVIGSVLLDEVGA